MVVNDSPFRNICTRGLWFASWSDSSSKVNVCCVAGCCVASGFDLSLLEDITATITIMARAAMAMTAQIEVRGLGCGVAWGREFPATELPGTDSTGAATVGAAGAGGSDDSTGEAGCSVVVLRSESTGASTNASGSGTSTGTSSAGDSSDGDSSDGDSSDGDSSDRDSSAGDSSAGALSAGASGTGKSGGWSVRTSDTEGAAVKVSLLYPGMMKRSPVDIFTLSRSATACILNVPSPLTLAAPSCRAHSTMVSANSFMNVSAVRRFMPDALASR